MIISQVDIENAFRVSPAHWIALSSDQVQQYEAIRESGKLLALSILNNTPRCADQQAAIRKVREAVMTANAAIALKGAW